MFLILRKIIIFFALTIATLSCSLYTKIPRSWSTQLEVCYDPHTDYSNHIPINGYFIRSIDYNQNIPGLSTNLGPKFYEDGVFKYGYYPKNNSHEAWGIYRIKNDTIVAQAFQDRSGMSRTMRKLEYVIHSKNEIELISNELFDYSGRLVYTSKPSDRIRYKLRNDTQDRPKNQCWFLKSKRIWCDPSNMIL